MTERDAEIPAAARSCRRGQWLIEAAAKRGVPLAMLDVGSAEAAALYGRKLVLSPPDQHVAWRGNEIPADPLALIDRVRGAVPIG